MVGGWGRGRFRGWHDGSVSCPFSFRGGEMRCSSIVQMRIERMICCGIGDLALWRGFDGGGG